jgi:hypothetical protein
VLACHAPWLTAAHARATAAGLDGMAAVRNAPRQPRFALDLVEDASAASTSPPRPRSSAPAFTPTLLSGLFDGSGAGGRERERADLFAAYREPPRARRTPWRNVSARRRPICKGKRIAT